MGLLKIVQKLQNTVVRILIGVGYRKWGGGNVSRGSPVAIAVLAGAAALEIPPTPALMQKTTKSASTQDFFSLQGQWEAVTVKLLQYIK